MKRTTAFFIAGAFISLLFVTTLWNRPTAKAQPIATPDGFTIREFGFNQRVSDRPPQIPPNWRLFAVSGGEKANSNDLWFQDTSGNIFMMSGEKTGPDFAVSPFINELPIAR